MRAAEVYVVRLIFTFSFLEILWAVLERRSIDLSLAGAVIALSGFVWIRVRLIDDNGPIYLRSAYVNTVLTFGAVSITLLAVVGYLAWRDGSFG